MNPGYAAFLQGLLRDPRGVCAPTPSSASLAEAMAAEVPPGRPGWVVELGPGTGVVTAALIAANVAPERIIAIESSSYFAALLQKRFATVRVIRGDAFAYQRHIPWGDVAAVVSGLPLLNFAPEQRAALIQAAIGQCAGGRFIQLSYGWKPPIAPGTEMTLKKKVVWGNIPPAHIWTYTTCQAETRPLRAAE